MRHRAKGEVNLDWLGISECWVSELEAPPTEVIAFVRRTPLRIERPTKERAPRRRVGGRIVEGIAEEGAERLRGPGPRGWLLQIAKANAV